MYGSLRCVDADGYWGGTSGTNTDGSLYWWGVWRNKLIGAAALLLLSVFTRLIHMQAAFSLQPCSASGIKQTVHFDQVQYTYRWQIMWHSVGYVPMRNNIYLVPTMLAPPKKERKKKKERGLR